MYLKGGELLGRLPGQDRPRPIYPEVATQFPPSRERSDNLCSEPIAVRMLRRWNVHRGAIVQELSDLGFPRHVPITSKINRFSCEEKTRAHLKRCALCLLV